MCLHYLIKHIYIYICIYIYKCKTFSKCSRCDYSRSPIQPREISNYEHETRSSKFHMLKTIIRQKSGQLIVINK